MLPKATENKIPDDQGTVPLISRGASFVIPRGVRRVPHGVVLTPCCCSTHTGANITCGATVTGTTEHAPNTLGEASGERFFAFEVEYIDQMFMCLVSSAHLGHFSGMYRPRTLCPS